MNVTKLALYALIMAMVSSSITYACSVRNENMYVKIQDLINRSPRIFTARIINRVENIGEYPILVNISPRALRRYEDGDKTSGFVPFLIEVESDLKGSGPSKGIIFGYTPPSSDAYRKLKMRSLQFGYLPNLSLYQSSYERLLEKENFDYFDHTLQAFWGDDAGRTQQNSDCLAHPMYFENSTYLIFTGEQHVKGYEVINSDQDGWLTYIKSTLESK